ncbi:hypothetical protein ANCDUO_01189 [Ancylostoma duodenale]|uniref:G-protein coupled receptors family 1 profile domain-containing protein n=1 Tax=Ancylostoma duodenale TaxID=51022 RepID=A0A0C2HA01_9BILA|nr:hypothetical protein ANCDUO_01189 [Ancylostoma duodenale]
MISKSSDVLRSSDHRDRRQVVLRCAVDGGEPRAVLHRLYKIGFLLKEKKALPNSNPLQLQITRKVHMLQEGSRSDFCTQYIWACLTLFSRINFKMKEEEELGPPLQLLLRTACGSWMTTVPLVVGTLFCVIVPSTFHFFHIIHHTFTIPGMDHITVCIPNMDDHVFNMYAQYTFVVGFVIPFFLMTVCYILLVRHVRAKFRHRKVTVSSTKGIKEPRYMHEMRKSIWRIAVFHFICWAPFWTFAIVPHYIAQLWGHDFLERLPGWYIYCRLFANCLPYINAAGNWVLYALLNYDVRKHIYNKPYQRFLFSSLSTV